MTATIIGQGMMVETTTAYPSLRITGDASGGNDGFPQVNNLVRSIHKLHPCADSQNQAIASIEPIVTGNFTSIIGDNQSNDDFEEDTIDTLSNLRKENQQPANLSNVK